MRLTSKQVLWVNQERETLKRIIASKPSEGLFRYVAREEALKLIIRLHNLEGENNA